MTTAIEEWMTMCNLHRTQQAQKKHIKRREGIEKLNNKCLDDVEKSALKGIDNVLAVAPVVEPSNDPDLLFNYLGIKKLKPLNE